MVQRITIAPQGPELFPFCDGLLAIDGLEYVRPPAGQFY